MKMTVSLFLAALGLAFIIEGTPYFLFSERVRGLLARMSALPPSVLRGLGLFAILSGLGLVYLATRLPG